MTPVAASRTALDQAAGASMRPSTLNLDVDGPWLLLTVEVQVELVENVQPC